MPAITYEHRDFSENYKTFLDLKDGDSIFVLDYKNVNIEEHKISKYSKEDKSDYFKKGFYVVQFEIPDLDNRQVKIYNGNQLIEKDGEIFYSTDKRLCQTIKDIIYKRNNYQWETITNCFGNPMSRYRYADKPVVLC